MEMSVFSVGGGSGETPEVPSLNSEIKPLLAIGTKNYLLLTTGAAVLRV